jgi:UDP-N-acetyl-D-glucosamine dehydrogenase
MRQAAGMSGLGARLARRSAHVVISGVGYVGSPLGVELARAGFRVTGLDVDAERVDSINGGRSYVGDVPSEALAAVVESGFLRGTTRAEVLAEADVVVVSVPTPLSTTREPNIRHIIDATDAIARYQHDDMLVVLESTTYPGTTAEVLVPRLTRRQRLGESVFIAYSPQRTDPGNQSSELVVIMTDHAALDRRRLLAEGKLVVDARNALGKVDGEKAAVHGL